MNELTSLLVNSYVRFNMGASSRYDPPKNSNLKVEYGGLSDRYNTSVTNMSAVLTNQGIVTQQTPGESFDGLDEKIQDLNPVYRSDIKSKYRLGKEFDLVYRNFINSSEGKELINYIHKNGNGTSKIGSIDDILVVNKGRGLVAATMPDLLRKNLIINQDYIDEYITAASKASGLSRRKIIENILVHELHHIYGQTKSDRTGSEKDIEYNNDISLIKFYTNLAQKDLKNSNTYLAKAKLFSARYDGNYKKTMDDIIQGAQKNVYMNAQDITLPVQKNASALYKPNASTLHKSNTSPTYNICIGCYSKAA